MCAKQDKSLQLTALNMCNTKWITSTDGIKIVQNDLHRINRRHKLWNGNCRTSTDATKMCIRNCIISTYGTKCEMVNALHEHTKLNCALLTTSIQQTALKLCNKHRITSTHSKELVHNKTNIKLRLYVWNSNCNTSRDGTSRVQYKLQHFKKRQWSLKCKLHQILRQH